MFKVYKLHLNSDNSVNKMFAYQTMPVDLFLSNLTAVYS